MKTQEMIPLTQQGERKRERERIREREWECVSVNFMLEFFAQDLWENYFVLDSIWGSIPRLTKTLYPMVTSWNSWANDIPRGSSCGLNGLFSASSSFIFCSIIIWELVQLTFPQPLRNPCLRESNPFLCSSWIRFFFFFQMGAIHLDSKDSEFSKSCFSSLWKWSPMLKMQDRAMKHGDVVNMGNWVRASHQSLYYSKWCFVPSALYRLDFSDHVWHWHVRQISHCSSTLPFCLFVWPAIFFISSFWPIVYRIRIKIMKAFSRC